MCCPCCNPHCPVEPHAADPAQTCCEHGAFLAYPGCSGTVGLSELPHLLHAGAPARPSHAGKMGFLVGCRVAKSGVCKCMGTKSDHPFYKHNGKSVRAVVCSECLLNFGVGCSFSMFHGHISLACGRSQFGGWRMDEAALMVAEVRGAARIFPYRAIAEWDAANAFACVSRARGL